MCQYPKSNYSLFDIIDEKINVNSRAPPKLQKQAALLGFFAADVYSHKKVFFTQGLVRFNPICRNRA
jgi:hypothetical protein